MNITDIKNKINILYTEIQENNYDFIIKNFLSIIKAYNDYNIYINSNINSIKFEIENYSNLLYINLKQKQEKITEKNLICLIETNEKILELNSKKIELENNLLYLKAIKDILNSVEKFYLKE